ncbi:MAG TPA: GGDEF domain-containing protein [Gammaproteobacteria bacterium]|nr:GGDEF domain-containing protein [Gammaproteobacteria bacterium]
MRPVSRALPRPINSRSTLFGFIVVMLLSVALVVGLLVQLDTWSQAGFELVKKNMQQARLVLIMRSAVQQRGLVIQRMMNISDVFSRDEEASVFNRLAGEYIGARNQLMQTEPDDALLDNLRQLDKAVAYAYPYHNNLVDALVFGNHTKEELNEIIHQGLDAREKVLLLLDRIVEGQGISYEMVLDEYENSRRFTLFGVGAVFLLILFVVVFAIRASNKQFSYISHLSIMDEVSGIYNRRYFDMVLEEEWRRSMREYTSLSLLMMDIDFFKAYNDAYGHQQGDDCLNVVGSVLSTQLRRASDFAARYGGEEFAIVLPGTGLEHALMLAQRLRQSVEEAGIKAGDSTVSPYITVSVGVAAMKAQVGQSSASLVRAADRCLYESKLSGRNRVCCSLADEDEVS